jgi:hypothetical protein
MSVEDQALTSTADPEDGEHDDAGEHDLPHESLSPITMAAGIGLLGFGLLTSLAFSIVGLVVMVWALMSWIEEMRRG